jgi:hypothetical protein
MLHAALDMPVQRHQTFVHGSQRRLVCLDLVYERRVNDEVCPKDGVPVKEREQPHTPRSAVGP